MDPDAPDQPVRLGLGDPLAGLAAWLAEGRVDDAAASRSRQRWLQRQAAEDRTFHRSLIDLAESRTHVTVTTRASTRLSGLITAVGHDFVVVEMEVGGDAVVPARSIAATRSGSRPGSAPPGSAPPRDLGMTLAACLVELSAEQPGVALSAGPEQIRGRLIAAGRDLVTVEIGPAGDVVQVLLAALDHLRLFAA